MTEKGRQWRCTHTGLLPLLRVEGPDSNLGTTPQEPEEGEEERRSSQEEGLSPGERKASRRWSHEESSWGVYNRKPGLLGRAGHKHTAPGC